MNPTLKTIIVAAAAAASLIPAATAGAAPTVDGEFPTTGSLTGTPNRLTTGPDGNIWVAEGTLVAKITPSGQVTEYDPPNIQSAVGIAAADGKLWVTQTGGVASFLPENPNDAVPTSIADITDARGIVLGSDNNLWTASGDKLVKIPPAAPQTATSTTIAGMAARDIAASTDGTLWIADFGGQRVVNVTTAGASTPYPTGGGPQGIAAGPAGQVAFANPGANPHHIGRLSPGGQPQTVDVPQTDPFGVVFGTDGAYWSAQFASNTLARVTPDGQLSTLSGFSAGSGPRYLTVGPSNTLWVGLETAKKVARVSGVVAPAPEPPAAQPPAAEPPAQGPATPRASTSRLRFGRTAMVDAAAALRSATVSRAGAVALTVRNRNAFAVRGTATLTARLRVATTRRRVSRMRTVSLAAPRSFALGARGTRAGVRTLSFRLTRSARAHLGAARRMSAKVTLVVRDPSGGRRTVTRAITLRAPAR